MFYFLTEYLLLILNWKFDQLVVGETEMLKSSSMHNGSITVAGRLARKGS